MQNYAHNILTLTLIAFSISFLIAIPIINILYKLKVVRKIDVDFSTIIDERKDKYGTPIMGGIIFIFAITIVTLLFNNNEYTKVPLIIFIITGLLGAADDLLNILGTPRKFKTFNRVITLIKVHKSYIMRLLYILTLPYYFFVSFMHLFESNPGNGLRAHEKILIQGLLGTCLGMWFYKMYGGLLWLPFLGTFDIGLWIVPFAIFVFMATTNAVNITDGMDGLSSGIGIIVLISFSIVAFLSQNIEVATFAMTAVGALIAYLYFNIKPARIQMGDTGSFALGAFICIISFLIGKPMLLIFAAFPYIIETLSTIIQSVSRRVFGRRIFQMAPFHHHLEMIGWSEEKVVTRFWIFALICNLFALWISFF